MGSEQIFPVLSEEPERGGQRAEPEFLPWTKPNMALEPTPRSVRCAPAAGRGSPRAFGENIALDTFEQRAVQALSRQ
jgi:hypothetical protein